MRRQWLMPLGNEDRFTPFRDRHPGQIVQH
jgi:hypothetical protein